MPLRNDNVSSSSSPGMAKAAGLMAEIQFEVRMARTPFGAERRSPCLLTDHFPPYDIATDCEVGGELLNGFRWLI